MSIKAFDRRLAALEKRLLKVMQEDDADPWPHRYYGCPDWHIRSAYQMHRIKFLQKEIKDPRASEAQKQDWKREIYKIKHAYEYHVVHDIERGEVTLEQHLRFCAEFLEWEHDEV